MNGKKGKNLSLTALGVWWMVFFTILVFIALIINVNTLTLQRTVAILVICAALAVGLDFLFVKLIFPKTMKEAKNYKVALKELQANGMSEELKDYMVTQYTQCANRPNINYMYMLFYAKIIAAYYCDIGDFQNAYAYINSVDFSRFETDLKYSQVRQDIKNYYKIKLEIECEAGDRASADITYRTFIDFVNSYSDELSITDSDKIIMYHYELICGKIQFVLNKLKEIKTEMDCDEINRLVFISDAYRQLGDYNSAYEYLNRAYKKAKYNHDKQCIERRMALLNSQN